MADLFLGRLRTVLDFGEQLGLNPDTAVSDGNLRAAEVHGRDRATPLPFNYFEVTITFDGYVERRIRMEHRVLAHQDPFLFRKLARKLSARSDRQAQRRISLLAVNFKRLFRDRTHLPKIWAGRRTSNRHPF